MVDILINHAGDGFCDLSEASDAENEIQQVWDRTVNLDGRGTATLSSPVIVSAFVSTFDSAGG
jgi:hypothetical protein